MNKKILFLLPGIANHPIGGYKVVYEYSNRLAEIGYDVKIAYPAYMNVEQDGVIKRFLRVLKAILRYLYCVITKKHSCCKWFDLDERVKECMVYTLNEKHCPISDVYVATSVKTAYYLNTYKNKSPKLYLIQGYENWNGISEEFLIATYRYPFRKIIISNWLYNIVEKHDSNCVLIHNGFDFSYFKRYIDAKERDKYHLAMMYHIQKLKPL